MDLKKSAVVPVAIGLLVVAGIAAGVFAFGNTQSETKVMVDKDVMMQKEGMQDETAMMEKNDEVMMDKKEGETGMEKNDSVMMSKGSYQVYSANKLALAASEDVVLFFRATWCPTCRAVDADIRANISAIPAGLTILDVNYDSSSALKQKYGVTTQHTFVQVAADGTLIKKWTGSPTLAALALQVQ